MTSLSDRLVTSVIDRVPRDHWESDSAFRRRRRVVTVTGVVGTALLSRSLQQEPDSKAFYLGTSAVAATWLVGGFGAGKLHLGHLPGPGSSLQRPVATPLLTGAGAFAAFYGCALVARKIPVLDRAIAGVLTFADEGSTPLVLATTLANGAAEEVFFRGALYAATSRPHQVAVSTAAYTLTTVGTKNPALVLAATVMGALFGLQRRATGGIQAPLLTHLTWSTLMLRFLPPLFRDRVHPDDLTLRRRAKRAGLGPN